ncbi:LysR family transcriptional regulator [Pseudooceanicola sp. LIPI14-2-Ac024]|uniref:LysR family transcriptional regulator n=1 Tax=Pseudooceanicola sp. LIPI14-2-Ac024 TaxID=3344875 RepID=UPI0035D107E3
MDRLTEMEAFVAVVDMAGFTEAARSLGLSKSTVSKQVAALESRLGTRLLNRTTRRVGPTEIGLAYYERALRVVQDAREADALATSMQSAPAGVLRISVPSDFGVTHLAPVIGNFVDQFPSITVNMVLTNRYVEMVSEGFDMAIRIGDLNSSSLIARKLATTRRRLVASPGYLRAEGRPERIEDLKDHRLLAFSDTASDNVWALTSPTGEDRQVRAAGRFVVNDSRSLLAAAISGLGIAYLPDFIHDEALAEGQVELVLPDLPARIETVHAVYPPGRKPEPKVRAFIDFLVDTFAEARSNAA